MTQFTVYRNKNPRTKTAPCRAVPPRRDPRIDFNFVQLRLASSGSIQRTDHALVQHAE